MAVLATLVRVFLALGVVIFVGYPLLRPQPKETARSATPEEERLFERRAAAESALQELEFDYRTGKLADKDYRELEARYQTELADAEALLGMQVEGVVAAKAAGAPSAAGVPVGGECPACGFANPQGAKFCGSCGEKLTTPPTRPRPKPGPPLAPTCSECGAELRPGNKFCGSCGAKVSARS
jgi:hypothetical protein